MLQDNLSILREKIAQACVRVGRDPADIGIIAVSKGIGPELIKQALEAGIRDIAESRMQEAREKIAQLGGYDICWHLVGHLQRNKVRHAVKLFEWIHSLDSLRLAHELERRAALAQRKPAVFMQVNISQEATKYGFSPRQAQEAAAEILKLKNLNLRGLMTIAPFRQDTEEIRRCFRQLRELRDKISQECGRELLLSMGMSNDFEVAVEEGADFLRIGSAIFRGQ